MADFMTKPVYRVIVLKHGRFIRCREESMDTQALKTYRYFLKDSIRKKINFRNTDQNRSVPPPPIQNPCPADAILIDLPGPEEWNNIAPIEPYPSHCQQEKPTKIPGSRSFQGRTILSFMDNPGASRTRYPRACISHRAVCRMPPCLLKPILPFFM